MSQYATSLDELSHEALVSAREEAVSPQIAASFSRLTVLSDLRELRSHYRSRVVTPAIVHCHSSYAGALVRMERRPRGTRVVYSPHALAHSARRWYEPRAWTAGIEWALRGRADAYGAVGAFEADQLMALGIPRSKVFVVPHFVPVPDQPRAGSPDAIVAVGRVCAQKNPAFFAEVARRLAQQPGPSGGTLRFYWAGGGDPALTRMLEESGVSVTGWLDREELLRFLSERAVVLVHGAHYEGLPLALLEAMSLGVPVVARRIPSLVELTSPALVESADEAASTVRDLISTDAIDVAAKTSQEEVRQKFNLARQRDVLAAMYGLESE
ncbi:glycosyltransferase family 4 protein [Micromonospora sp. DPT]|uniref:glycosyltransferase family 4 protein n=1 Tax=Micromonospora sp. DPT TaxID=3142975 RepID=UPI0032097A7E